MNYLNMDSVIIPWDSADGAPYLEEDHWDICHQGGEIQRDLPTEH